MIYIQKYSIKQKQALSEKRELLAVLPAKQIVLCFACSTANNSFFLKEQFLVRTKKTRAISGDRQNPLKYQLREKLRKQYILPKHIGRFFFVHNGKSYISVHIQKKMLGHKFGEFATTRQKPVHKKKRK